MGEINGRGDGGRGEALGNGGLGGCLGGGGWGSVAGSYREEASEEGERQKRIFDFHV